MLKKILAGFLLLTIIFTGRVNAFKADTFVTFANPVRGLEGWSSSKQHPLDLPIALYRESTPSATPMTWMLRYDAVTDATISAFFKDLTEIDRHQSLGALLEITPLLADKANIMYPVGLAMSDANRLFLSGYTLTAREDLIDTYMDSFFRQFGSYPKSVFAAHLDSYSLQYLQSKYSVLTAMISDEQYGTDQVRLWGGYLGSPYFPDKNNSLIPARSLGDRVNLAMVRWSQKDLFNFYGPSSESQNSLQLNDILGAGQGIKYFEKLLDVYGQKSFNEFTYLNIGLGNDLDPKLFRAEMKNVYRTLKEKGEKYNLRRISLSDFGDWLKARYPESSPAYFYETKDLKGQTSGTVYWYQTPFFRIGLKSVAGQTKIIDFRVYNRDIYEDYYATTNQEAGLFSEIPAIIDSVKFPGTELVLDFDFENATIEHKKIIDNWQIKFLQGDKSILLATDKIVFTGFTAPEINTQDLQVIKNKNITVWETKPHTPFKNTSKATPLFWLVLIIVIVKIIKKIKRSGGPQIPAYLFVGFLLAMICGFALFRNGLQTPFGLGFWGPNGHDAIFHLSLIEKFSAHPLSFSHPQIAGEKISNYHFLFDFVSGILVRLSGISASDFYFRVFPLLAGFLIVYLLDKLLKSWNYSRPERLLSLLLVFLTGSFGFIPKLLTGQDFLAGESAFWSNQSVSIFLNPPFALSIIVLLLILNSSSLRNSGNPEVKQSPLSINHSSLGLIILGGLLAQTKVYAFILLLGALLFSKKYKLFFSILIVGILISLPFTILGGASPFIFSPLWFPRSLFASFDRFYWPALVSAWQAYEASGNLIKLSLVNLFALGIFWIGNLGTRVLGLWQIMQTKPINLAEIIIRWIIGFGLLLPISFVQNINPWNTIQFMYYSLFFLGIFLARWLANKHWLVILPVLFLSVVTSIGTLRDYIGFFSASRVSYTESLALEKLREQPPGIVLSPIFSTVQARHIAAPKPLYSYVSTAYISAWSGQPEFLSDTINLDITGFDYSDRARDIQRFYNTEDKDWAVSFLDTNNIKYVYETPLQKIKLSPFDLKLTKIFDSGEINVYKYN